jgi:large repetitive protein
VGPPQQGQPGLRRRAGADPARNAGAIADAELYNPESGTFIATGKLQAARYRATALLLNTGAVLLSGGGDEKGYLSSAELYNPTTQTFTVTGGLKVARLGHKLALLRDGMVLVVGGQGEGGALASAELYDPVAGAFAVTR